MTKTNEIDYKTLATGTMIWVSTCYGERLAKFLGYHRQNDGLIITRDATLYIT